MWEVIKLHRLPSPLTGAPLPKYCIVSYIVILILVLYVNLYVGFFLLIIINTRTIDLYGGGSMLDQHWLPVGESWTTQG